jgi:hypothetical protein
MVRGAGILNCVAWDGKRAGPWWIGHAPKSRVFSSKQRHDDFEIRTAGPRIIVLFFKISSFRKRDECDINFTIGRKQITIVNIRII